MMDTIAAIEQETKYMQDSEEGSKQYRTGYVHALRAVSEFLIGVSAPCIRHRENASVKRLFAFVALQRNPRGDNALPTRPDTGIQRDTAQIAADVLRSSNENADFVQWWLHTYENQVLSSARHATCPIFPDYPAPTSETELDSLEDKFNRCYPEGQMIRRHRKRCCIPRR